MGERYSRAVEAAVNRVLGRYPGIVLRPTCAVSNNEAWCSVNHTRVWVGQSASVLLVGGGVFSVNSLYNGRYHAHTQARSLMPFTEGRLQPQEFRPICDTDASMNVMLAYVMRTAHRVMRLVSGVVGLQRAFRRRSARRRRSVATIATCFRAAVSDPARRMCRRRLAREFGAITFFK